MNFDKAVELYVDKIKSGLTNGELRSKYGLSGNEISNWIPSEHNKVVPDPEEREMWVELQKESGRSVNEFVRSPAFEPDVSIYVFGKWRVEARGNRVLRGESAHKTELKKLSRARYTRRLREKAVAMYESGVSAKEVARLFGVRKHESVYAWAHKAGVTQRGLIDAPDVVEDVNRVEPPSLPVESYNQALDREIMIREVQGLHSEISTLHAEVATLTNSQERPLLPVIALAIAAVAFTCGLLVIVGGCS